MPSDSCCFKQIFLELFSGMACSSQEKGLGWHGADTLRRSCDPGCMQMGQATGIAGINAGDVLLPSPQYVLQRLSPGGQGVRELATQAVLQAVI